MSTKGRECWGGFSFAAFRNWGPMVGLATSGLIMLVAEWLAFELLTLAASYLSGAHLAAQSVLSTIAGLTYQLPFAVSVAASTRIANLIGATLSDAAKLSARVALCASLIIGTVNSIVLFSMRNVLPGFFTSDAEVARLVVMTLPICVAFQLFDATASALGGILRGIGRQEVGGYFNLIGYYGFAIPTSLLVTFVFDWGLIGLWTGPALTLAL
jgi:MATE family multidrug resistance protein